jgi:hypothetical protein
MRARLSHCARVGAQVGAREDLRVVGWSRARAEMRVHCDVARARARKGRGCFYRPAALQGSFAELSLATVATAWARRRLATCGGWRPMEEGGSPAGECGKAAWHRPRPFARVTGLRCTVPTAPGLGPRGIPAPRCARTLGVWRRPTLCGSTCSRLQNDFSPRFETKVH